MPKDIEPPAASAGEEERAAYLALLPHPGIWNWRFCPGTKDIRHDPLVAIGGARTACFECKPINWAIVQREAERLLAGYAA